MTPVQIRRLTSQDRALARGLFAMMAQVFGEPCEPLSDQHLDRLLGSEAFWAMAAVSGEEVIGGITAHAVPMTTSDAFELFVYDLAVRETHQRKGVGRQLWTALREAAASAGIREVFVPAEAADDHALAFYRALGGMPTPVTFFSFSQPEG